MNIHIKHYKIPRMFNEPNWLDLEEELYPTTLMHKILCVQDYPAAGTVQSPVDIIYNSLHRQIDLTDALTGLISQFFIPDAFYEIIIFDPLEERFRTLAQYPFKELIILKGVFIESEVIYLKVEEVDELGNSLKDKCKKPEKTLKDILQLVGKWRKIYSESKKKITLEKAAEMIGVCKNTLDDYYLQIKLAEKYQFPFQKHYQESFSCVRKYVKEKHEKKDKDLGAVMSMLQKYQN